MKELKKKRKNFSALKNLKDRYRDIFPVELITKLMHAHTHIFRLVSFSKYFKQEREKRSTTKFIKAKFLFRTKNINHFEWKLSAYYFNVSAIGTFTGETEKIAG